jgi:RNA polymerase sigma-70 factor (ECF subfamily)
VGPGELDEGPTAEAALLHAGRDGDRAALERLIALHERPLFALCHGILGHVEDAEDAAQETFLRALRGLTAFRGEATFRTWLFRIAINVCLERKAAHRPTAPWDEEQPSIPPDATSPEAMALRQLRVMEALKSLPPRQRIILLLKEREGWSVAEIAVALQCKERQVEYALTKARRTLVEWRRRERSEGEAE